MYICIHTHMYKNKCVGAHGVTQYILHSAQFAVQTDVYTYINVNIYTCRYVCIYMHICMYIYAYV